jgi:hypothetical protein
VFTPHQVRSASEAFAALEISPTPDAAAIKSAFRKRIQAVHPDRFSGDDTVAKQVISARELLDALASAGTLASLVAEVQAYEAAAEGVDFSAATRGSDMPIGGRETSIPNYKKSVVLEYAGGGEYTLFLYGQFLRGNLSPLAAVRTLRSLIGPRFQGSLRDILVWVLVPGVSVRQFSFPDLEDALEMAVPPDAPPRATARAPVQPPESGHRPDPERPSTNEEAPAGLAERFSGMDWTGLSMGYVIQVEGGNVRVFRLKRVRGRVDVSYFGSYDSSAAALRDLNRKGLNPDLVPVWLLADVLAGEPTRLGAA